MRWGGKWLLLLLLAAALPGALRAGPANNTLEIPIPKNHPAKGVHLPFYTDNVLQMFFDAEVLSRFDARRLKMEQLRIEICAVADRPPMSIEMPSALFDVQTKMLTGTNTFVVRRSDFEVTGQRLVFNTQTRAGTSSGPTRMLVFNIRPAVGERSVP